MKFRENWSHITSDAWILNTINGYEIELENRPKQMIIPKPFTFSDADKILIDAEIERFLAAQIIEVVHTDDSDEYISNIFFRPKKDGRIRIILNLKSFNEKHMEKQHFKMESLQSAVSAMRHNCWFGSVDLSEAFYSIPICKAHRKFFRFWHNNTKYQFTALIMGLTASPRVFTKILKPVFAKLRAEGHISTAYTDDSCLQGQTYDSCYKNIFETVHLMDSLGLTVHPKKSVLIPVQQIVFLGFILCSVSMTVRPTNEKCQKVIDMCHQILEHKRVTIRTFAQLIGKLVSLEQGVEYAPLYYKPLEKVKEVQLKLHRGNFDSFMTIPKEIYPVINWWIHNISSSFKLVSQGPPSLVIYSDSSTKAWGAFNKTDNIRTNGAWSEIEQTEHINVLELTACQLAVKSFCKNITGKHVRIFMDNSTSCAYINKFGGRVHKLDSIAREIWFWCIERRIHLSAAHVPGVENCEADEESRTINDDTEWSLRPEIFAAILGKFQLIAVDLFASRLNNKVKRYVSRRPDPYAYAIDAFSLTWADDVFYIFPPFSLLARILQKVEEDKTDAVLVAPIWPTQSWWPSLLHLIHGQCFKLDNPQKILYLPYDTERRHHLKRMTLAVFPISGKACGTKGSLAKQGTLLCNHGDCPLKLSTIAISQDGLLFAGSKLTPFNPMSVTS